MKFMFRLSALALLFASVSARVGDGGTTRNLELSQIQHRKLRRATENRAIEGQFIIVLSDVVENVLEAAIRLIAGATGAQLEYEYDAVVKGFAVSGLVADILLAILDDDLVEYVEEVSGFRFL